MSFFRMILWETLWFAHLLEKNQLQGRESNVLKSQNAV